MKQSQYTKGFEEGKRRARDQIIKRMARNGVPQTEIAQYVYISRPRINQILNEETEENKVTL